MKLLAVFLCAVTLSNPVPVYAAKKPYGPHNTDNYTQQELLKNWAFSFCTGIVWSKKGVDQVSDDGYKTASAYLEYSNAPETAFDSLRKLAEKYAHMAYDGSVAGEFNTMKCIDLFHSQELDKTVKQYAK